ncbi:MAG: hypothetical protein RIR77_41 [Planctomycetota bacterium]|jgi:hypothetical protein
MTKNKSVRLEKDLYPIVARWLEKQRKCFKSAINTGLKHGRIDVVGIRDVGGDLSGEIETVSIEVKRDSAPFATATGQALGYKVYANRIYLAEQRSKAFTSEEVKIAGHLGVGLIRITGAKCHEELSSPYYRLITRMNMLLIEKLGLGACQLCGTVFEIGNDPQRNKWSNLHRTDLAKAIKDERGLMFWNEELGNRKHKLGIRVSKGGLVFERRFLCPGCVSNIFAPLLPEAE